MKKFLSILLAMAMIAAMAPIAFADYPSEASFSLNHGGVYIKDDDDDDYYTEEVDSLAPGETGYVFIANYERDDDYEFLREEPRSISVEEQDIYDTESDEDIKLISVDSKAEKKKIGDGKYGWFAKIKVKSIKMSSYPEDGYDVEELLLEYSWDGEDYLLPVDLTFIGYEEADDELEEDPKMFSYEKDDDIEIDLPDSEGTFTGVAKKDFDIIASMDTKVNNSVLNKYPNADIRFFNGNGAKFPVSKGRLTIYADSDEYCYEVNSNGDYIDLSDTYSSKDKGFVITTTTLGKYIVSDAALRGAVSSGSTAAPAPSAPSTAPSTNTTYPVTSPIISNPNTGVWEG
ncbi:MAG: hypothetical protein II995_01165 [Oscillospiraceae bacterium]|nr:hypothetical protein [Oscillospiraceae bacterium]